MTPEQQEYYENMAHLIDKNHKLTSMIATVEQRVLSMEQDISDLGHAVTNLMSVVAGLLKAPNAKVDAVDDPAPEPPENTDPETNGPYL